MAKSACGQTIEGNLIGMNVCVCVDGGAMGAVTGVTTGGHGR